MLEVGDAQAAEQNALLAELTPKLASMSAKQRRQFKEKLKKKCASLMKRLTPLSTAQRMEVISKLSPMEKKNFMSLQIIAGYNV